MRKWKHWKKAACLATVLALLLVVNFSVFRYIPIRYLSTVSIVPDLPFLKFPMDRQYTWFIVNNDSQYKYWTSSGLNLPPCDFSRNYLIVSRYKITAVFYSPFINDQCYGAPRGIAVFNKSGSKSEFAYVYRMPTIVLTQGIG